ncbi:glutamate receptor ionotropic, NMDA 2B-like [Mya arenaria]|uniref:glutamate receptor ionotropic, NMDA 2B-like n=1 Tax=Mya arenaria TaxID=6604 RepID=UPI0022DF2E8E|nr:glutamate receptor ionotropic, NMDA 2B-like [Mya arenaria]
MHRILRRYNWTEFAIVTTKLSSSDDFISCMRDMVKRTSVTQGYVSTAKYTIKATVQIDIDDFDDSEYKLAVIRHNLKIIERTVSRVIILHAGSYDALDILDVAQRMNLTARKFMWLLTSSSMGARVGTMTTFPVGLLGILYNSSQEVIESAMETSVRLWALGLEQLARDDVSLSQINIYPENTCTATKLGYWRDGDRLYRAIKNVTMDDPPVSFSDNGVIENVELKIYNVRPHSNPRYARRGRNMWTSVGNIVPLKVGHITQMTIQMDEVVWPGGAVSPPLGKPEKRFFRIVTFKEEPYINYLSPDLGTGQCTHHAVPCKLGPNPPSDDPHIYDNATIDPKSGLVNFCCSGLSVDLLQILSEKMNFEYEMYEVPDQNWGIKDENGEWSGLVKEMIEKKADMVITSIKINHQRATAMEFSTPFLETGITILVALRKGAISATAFLEHKFSLFRSFWLIWAMLFGASVSTDNPRGVSSRFLANVWALFALVFLASYTANLAAFMITIDEYFDLSGIQDWRLMNPTAVSPHFKFATVPGGSTEDNIRMNYPRMHKYMKKYNKTSVPIGIRALKVGEIDAFIYDATVLEYNAGKDTECDLLTVGKWYAMTGYGVGFPKNSPHVDEVNKIILDLQRNGELDRLQKFWLAGACHAKKDKKDKASREIGIPNFTSAFILLATGVTLATILMLLEHCYFKFGRRCLKKYDKTGCCALVSLSMGKSLTFEQSVMDAIDFHKKHRCKDPLCETQLWKARHELDIALVNLERIKEELSHVHSGERNLISAPVGHETKPREQNGKSVTQMKDCNSESHYETPDSLRQRIVNNVSVDPFASDNRRQRGVNPQNSKPSENKVLELSDLDKKRQQFRRSPSYTNAISVDSDKKEENDSAKTISPPLSNMEINSPKRCNSYSQAVEHSPVLDRRDNDRRNTKTKYFDGKYYVGVSNKTDDSAL